MDLSTPKKKTNISNHIPMPLTYSLYRPSSLFKQQHELLTSISSPFIPSLRIQKKVSEFQRLSMTKIEKSSSETKQHQKNQIQKRQFITQLLESPKIQNKSQIQINVQKIPDRATLFLKPYSSKSKENKDESPQNQFILSKDILSNQQSLSQQQNNDPTFLPIKNGDCLKFQSQIPQQVTDIYLNFKKINKTQPNFIQGYIKKIDCIYYAVEKNLILHFPSGPRKTLVSLSNKCIIVKLPNILYNIVQTNLKMSFLEQIQQKSRKMVFKSSKKENREDQILIMCHPYYIELYYLSLKSYAKFTDDQNIKNPILKLNLRFSLPNCSKPHIFGISDSYLYYLSDKSTINLEYLCIETGQIKRIEGKNEKSLMKRNGYMKHQKQNEKSDLTENNTNWKLSNFLLSKLASCMMHIQPEGFIHKIGQKFCINAEMCKLICCEHNKKIACIMQLKTKNYIKKLFTQSHLKQGINYMKFVRVYQKNQTDPNKNKYMFQDILIQDYCNKILNIQFLNDQKSNEECNCKIKTQTINRYKKVIQQFVYTNSNKKYIKHLIRTIKVSEKEQQSPFILQTKNNETIIKHSGLIYISDKQTFRWNSLPPKNQSIQQYVYQSSNIITLCTDTGFNRFVTVTWHDLLYSTIHYYSEQPYPKNTEHISLIAQNLFKLSLNSLSQNNNKYESIIKLLKGLLKLCSTEKDQNLLLYQFKDNKIIIKSVQSASDKIQKICINVLNYYSINLNKFIVQFMGQDSVAEILQYINDIKGQQKDQVNNKPNIFNFGKIYQYFNCKQQTQTNEQQNKQNTQQKCNLQKQFNEIALKIFSQQKQSKLYIEPSVLLSRILIKYSFMLEISQMLKSIWDQSLNDISIEEVQNILNKLDKISIVAHIIQQKLGFSIFQIYSPIVHSKQEGILSPGSTLAHSNISNKLNDPYQMESITNINSTSKSQSIILQKIGQMLMLTEIVQKQCPNLLFSKILYEDPCYFSPYIFKKFVQDYDNHLFIQLEKAIPSYLNARDKQISYKSDYAHYLPLKFWLVLFVEICGISNKMKIVKIIQQKLQSYNIIRLHQIYKNLNVKLKKDQPTIIVPEYFVQYLDRHKDIRFIDLNLMNIQEMNIIDARESLQKTIKDQAQAQEKRKKKIIEYKLTHNENDQKLTEVEVEVEVEVEEKQSKLRSNSMKKRKEGKEGINLKQIISNKKNQLST